MNILLMRRRLAVRHEPQRLEICNLPGFALLTTSLQSRLMGGSTE